MLTKITIWNFKRFNHIEIELGNPVVFVGPNNSGKSTALQALALWDVGLKKWIEKRGGKSTPKKRPGVTINRRDLLAVPVPNANLLWKDLHVRDVRRVNGEQKTQNIRVDILVEGVTRGIEWKCGLEFDYVNEESLYCRPLRLSDAQDPQRMPIPEEANGTRVAFLPPMSGLADREFAKQAGEISFLIGQGRTAEVLRNLCLQITVGDDREQRWSAVHGQMFKLFGVRLDPPAYTPERSEITMTYQDASGVRLDLSSSGRGLQQTLLLLAHLSVNPGSVLLLDEPDAHLEILRQRQIYQVLSEAAREYDSQIVAASHSEIVLNEAADRDVVIAFVGRPHRIDDRGSQVLKALKEIGFEQYYQAELSGWVLYLEGSTDLAILRAFARTIAHPVEEKLQRPFVYYVSNLPNRAREHFYGLREAKKDLVGFALFDRLDQQLQSQPELRTVMWRKREIENYLCHREVLLKWASEAGAQQGGGPLFAPSWVEIMERCIHEIEQAMETLGLGSPWSSDTKVSDHFLDSVFDMFFREAKLPNLMSKTHYHELARLVPPEQIDPEVTVVLDGILEVANAANPSIG